MEEKEPGPPRRSRWQPSPIEEWSRPLRLEIPSDIFERLPRNADYRFEYYDGAGQISPRAKTSDAYLPLSEVIIDDEPEGVTVREVNDADWDAFPEVFAAAFAAISPFALLDDADRLLAARDCLAHTRSGGDGPLVATACQIAVDREDGRPLGAALVTLPMPHQLLDFDARRLRTGAPPTETTAWPHLTWIFVAPFHAGEGIGTALLAGVCRALRGLGHSELASSFQHGNTSSLRWHWRNGFRLLPYFGSKRWMTHRRRDV